MAPKFTEKGMYALNYPASAENTLNLTYYPLLWQAGGEVYTKDGDVGFDSKEGVQALTFLTDLAEAGALDPEALTTNVPLEQTAVAQGKVACTWNNAVNEVVPFWGEENVKVLAPLTEKESVAYGTVGSLSVLKGSKAQDAAASSSSTPPVRTSSSPTSRQPATSRRSAPPSLCTRMTRCSARWRSTSRTPPWVSSTPRPAR